MIDQYARGKFIALLEPCPAGIVPDVFESLLEKIFIAAGCPYPEVLNAPI